MTSGYYINPLTPWYRDVVYSLEFFLHKHIFVVSVCSTEQVGYIYTLRILLHHLENAFMRQSLSIPGLFCGLFLFKHSFDFWGSCLYLKCKSYIDCT